MNRGGCEFDARLLWGRRAGLKTGHYNFEAVAQRNIDAGRWFPPEEKRAQPRLAVPPKAPETLFCDAKADDAIRTVLAGMPAAAYTQEQRLRYEQEILEVCVSGHPLDFLPRNGEVWSDELDGLRGKRVTLCGWVVTYRHVGTKNYRNMMFVTLEDQRGLYEVVLFPDAYDRFGGLLFETRAMRVTGRVEMGGQISAERMEALKK
jgi:DNA polymerase III alpha subunit